MFLVAVTVAWVAFAHQETQMDLAVKLHLRGNLTGALAAFESVVRNTLLDAERCQARLNIAAIHHVRGERERANGALDNAAQDCGPNSSVEMMANLANTQGVIWLAQDASEKARAAFYRALELAPDHGHAALNLAHMLYASIFCDFPLI